MDKSCFPKTFSESNMAQSPAFLKEPCKSSNLGDVTIGVDARTICYPSSAERGIGTYAFHHFMSLFKEAPCWNFMVLIEDASQIEVQQIQTLGQFANVRIKAISDISADEIQLFHIPDPLTLLPGYDSPFRLFPDVLVTVIVHDLIPLIFKNDYIDKWDAGSRGVYLDRLHRLEKVQGRILTNSECTKRDLHQHLKIPLEKMTPIMAGLNQSSDAPRRTAVDQSRTLTKFKIQKPFFLTVGSLEPRKNFAFTANAFVTAQQEMSMQLVIAGSLNDPYKENCRRLFEAKGFQNVIFTGYLSREELDDLYANATALIFPSTYEGFGFPILEAMAQGCPVITCNNSSLPEVVGDAGILVETNNVQELTTAMLGLIKDLLARQKFIARGFEQAKKFTWEKVARETVLVMKELISSADRRSNISSAVVTPPTIEESSATVFTPDTNRPTVEASSSDFSLSTKSENGSSLLWGRTRVSPEISCRPKVLLIADVPNWVFARHSHTIQRLLSDEFEFSITYQGQQYDETLFNLIYPLEWHLVRADQIHDSEKYVTGIRSHLFWPEDFKAFIRFLETNFKRVHVVSQQLFDIFSPHLSEVAYVSHGVDTDFFSPSTKASHQGKQLKLGWNGNRKSAGNKGFAQFIEPLGHLPGIELVFCGYVDKHLSVTQMRDFYNEINAYVCASDKEGNNNALLEAAAMGRAIITTNNGTVTEYLQHETSALIVERNLWSFVQAAEMLRDNPDLRERLGQAARSAVTDGWDWKQRAEDYRRFFHEALRKNVTIKTSGEAKKNEEHHSLPTATDDWEAYYIRKVAPTFIETPTASDFHEDFYLKRYFDVAAAIQQGKFQTGWDHFVRVGRSEGRQFAIQSRWANAEYQNQPPVKMAIGLLTHNALEYTKICLRSIAEHTPFPHDVYIVDNASTDETRTWLATNQRPNLHVTLSDENLGVPGGRNRLLQDILPHLSDDGFIIFLDNDMEVFPGWYHAFIELFFRHPEAGVASSNGHPIIVHQEWRELLPVPTGHIAAIDVASGGFCFWMRASVARAVGVFDEKLGKFWHEDDDYSVRAIAQGYEVFYVPAPVYHHGHKSGVDQQDLLMDGGGSPENQRYLVNKWRQLGMVDESGRIIHPFRSDLDLRRKLGEKLQRVGPVSPEELHRAVWDLHELMNVPLETINFRERSDSFSPTCLSLLELYREHARQVTDPEPANRLQLLEKEIQDKRLGIALRKFVEVPVSSVKPQQVSLCKICDINDWDHTEWWEVISEYLREGYSHNFYWRSRAAWLQAQLFYGLKKLGMIFPEASSLVISGELERFTWTLANHIKEVIAFCGPNQMKQPKRSPFFYRADHLHVLAGENHSLNRPAGSLDFAVFLGTATSGNHEQVIKIIAELGRMVKPGGVVAVSCEVILNNVTDPLGYLPHQINKHQFAPTGLRLVEEMNWVITEENFDRMVDRNKTGWHQSVMLFLSEKTLHTSGVFFLRKTL